MSAGSQNTEKAENLVIERSQHLVIELNNIFIKNCGLESQYLYKILNGCLIKIIQKMELHAQNQN